MVDSVVMIVVSDSEVVIVLCIFIWLSMLY